MKIVIFIWFLLMVTGGWASSPGYVDSLKSEIARNGINDTVKTHLLLQLCYYSSNNPVQGIIYGKQALDLAQKTGRKVHQAYAFGYIGMLESRMGNSLQSVEAYVHSANIFRELGEVHQEGYALSSIGTAFQLQGDMVNALKYLRQGLQLFQTYSDTIQIANSFLNIGEGFRVANQPDSAIYYFDEGMKILEQYSAGDSLQANTTRNTIKGNLGMMHIDRGEFNKAEQELNDAIQFFSSVNDTYRTSVYNTALGKLYILNGQHQLGESKIKQSLQMAEVAQLKEQIRDINLELSNIYESKGKSDLALAHYKQYKSYDDSIKNVEVVRQMEQQQSQFELSKKEEQIIVLKRINKLQSNLAYVMLAAIVLFVVFVSVLFYANRRIKQSNLLISEQNKLLEQRELEKALLLRELNHRVKNNLQMVSSLLNLHSRQLKDHPAAEALMAGRYRVEALTLIHQKLYRDDIDTRIDIKDYVEDLTKNLVLNFGPEFTLDLKLESFVMKIDKAIPLGLIINELITNSLKYGGQNNNSPTLEIVIKNNANTVELTIADNGQGLPAGFDLAQSKSFGLKLVNSLIKQLSGKLDYCAENGTCWKLELIKEKID
jgi:two-component system, sensor histidine kinase PdtaS